MSTGCACDPGYTGSDCVEVVADACGPELRCNGNGRCEYGSCWCDPGWQGDSCDTRVECLKNCSGNGQCKWGQCWCDKYFTGDDCAKEDGELPGSTAGVSTRDSILIACGVLGAGVLGGILWKLVYEHRRRAQLRAFLQNAETDAVGQSYSHLAHVGDSKRNGWMN